MVEIHLTERCIPFHQTVKPIPDSKPDSKPDIRDSSSEVATAPADKVKVSFEKDSRPYKCALYLANQIAERIPGKKYAEATLQSWAKDFDRVNRLDGHSWDDIGTVPHLLPKRFLLARQHPFGSKVPQSSMTNYT